MGDIVIRVGGVEPVPAAGGSAKRISMLLWGPSGTGKTTLACTAPGKKLLVLFDPDGDASVAERNDVDVVDLSAARAGIVDMFKSSSSPLGLASALEGYDTVIIDSLTNAQHMTVMHGISKLTGATIEKPSVEVYQMRNALVTQLVKNVLMLTKRMNKHVIFIAHEAAPEKDKKGVVISITVALGGQLQTQAPVDFSEVWAVEDTGKTRRIGIRPVRLRRPMKTRMFNTNGEAEFEWKYDENNIATWYNAWRDGGYKKLPLPK